MPPSRRVTRGDTGQQLRFTAGFLWMCPGYYNHARPYRPQWEGMDRFQGVVVHPQRWPADLDLAGKRVVVIGSGATAATLIPAIAGTAEHVTMLQRSPSYFFAPPRTNELAETLRDLDIPDEWTHEILRRQYIKLTDWLARTALEAPGELHTFLIESMRPLLPEGFDIEKHFTPRYRPWQQRIAIVRGRRPVRGTARGDGLDRHRHHRDVHLPRDQSQLRRGDPRRHRRHRHRLQPVGLR